MSGVRAIGWSLDSPSGSAGAIAIVRLQAGNEIEMDRALAELGFGVIAPGTFRLRDLLGVDVGLIARFNGESALLMPHGGPGVVRALCEKLVAGGIPQQARMTAREVYPEASGDIEAEVLLALSQSSSSLAINLLLDQPKLWNVPGAVSDPARDRMLNRLIEPPLVVAIGASNIGKSTLANALAGRGVSLVADEPGTTRDHVGVMLDIAGLVVRYVDTPGIRADAPDIESEAAAIATRLARSADLVLLCGDGASPLPSWHPDPSELSPEGLSEPHLRIALRSDLAKANYAVDCSVSARDPGSIQRLVSIIREKLVPQKMLDDPRPWKFWDRAVDAGAAS